MAVKHDMIGLAISNVCPGMTAPGARGSVIGNNPFSYVVPAGNEKPIFLDIAMSVVAGTNIWIARNQGKQIPDNSMVDEDGIPTTDGGKYAVAFSLLPMGGYKGYGLAVLVEVLAAVLTGAGATTEVPSWGLDLPNPTNTTHAFPAFNVDKIIPIQQFKNRMDRMIRPIKESPKGAGTGLIFQARWSGKSGTTHWNRACCSLRR
jgi:LDH2 family malate/lactate/ureidoglycolate dehydrogenase